MVILVKTKHPSMLSLSMMKGYAQDRPKTVSEIRNYLSQRKLQFICFCFSYSFFFFFFYGRDIRFTGRVSLWLFHDTHLSHFFCLPALKNQSGFELEVMKKRVIQLLHPRVTLEWLEMVLENFSWQTSPLSDP